MVFYLLHWVLPVTLINWGFFIPYFYVRNHYKLNYVRYSVPIALYFILGCFTTFVTYPEIYRAPLIVFPPQGIALVSILLFLLLLVIIDRTQHKLFVSTAIDDYLITYHGSAFVHLNARFFLPKFFDVLFQQMLVLAAVVGLTTFHMPLLTLCIIFGLIFLLGHIITLFINAVRGKSVPLTTGITFCVASFFAGVIWPYILLRVPYGYIYTFITHMGYYILLGMYTRYTIKKSSITE